MMQFQLGANAPDSSTIIHRLRALDPGAEITIDAHGGVVEMISSASAQQIVHALDQLGCEAKVLDDLVHVSGGSTCCGGCA
ncbi:MAG: hypothetical protein J0H15_12070 [Xanthomonadales bacterium]|nr:hypothetical protein [Xanthomonadales bacterium]